MARKPHVNIASGDDRVDFQAGRVTSGSKAKTDPPKTAKAKPGRTVNIVSGNARVGVQTDRINGPITITF